MLLFGVTSCGDFLDTPTDDRIELNSAEKVAKIVSDHIVNGAPVIEYTVGAQE